MSSSSQQAPFASTASRSNNNNNNNGGNMNRIRGPRDDSPQVRLSKALSWLLRHNAESQRVVIRSDGYVKVVDVLKHPKFKGFTLEDVQAVVTNNDKKRFQISEEGNGVIWIRAVQGHSIGTIAALGYEEITDSTQVAIAVHGTMFSKWHLIKVTGLSKMNRNHIHMAIGLPGDEGVVSGMRNAANLYIYVDTAKALQ
ncbi:hypothetical protein BGZ65_002623, partial [Modicella reniformis]